MAATPYKLSPKARARVERLGILKMQIDALQVQYDALREEHAEYLQRVGHATTEKVGPVNAFLRLTKRWSYSEAVQRLQARLKALQSKEQESGIATYTETASVVVNLSAKVLAVEVGEKLNLDAFEEAIKAGEGMADPCLTAPENFTHLV
jgi:hypothetical protein